MNVTNNTNRLKNKHLIIIIAISVLINAAGMFFPILRNDDAVLYATIAKHIAQSGDWINLVFHGNDWLDKPHFLFWVVAVFFKILGINSFAYILPGFLFYVLGGVYTYKLAKELYNKEVGLLAAVCYFSAFHLMLSSIDVRAEAYLLGTIIPACYYWYLYDKTQKINWSYLLLGAIFTGCAIMTKGLFVLVTIMSGLVGVLLYTKRVRTLLTPKWFIAVLLSLICILPELVSLYIQIDLHPDKIIFGHTHVSGLKWFFWDSQVGRFFNNGPISTHPGKFHDIYFVHTFLWAFLPWSVLFLASSWAMIKVLCENTVTSSTSNLSYRKRNIVYLFSSFGVTFIMFSISKFQLDYYTNIIMPFASIICARWLYRMQVEFSGESHTIFYFQIWLAIILTLVVTFVSIFIFGKHWIWLTLAIGLLMLALYILFMHKSELFKAILYPVLAINLVFIFCMLVYGKIYEKYDVGYQTARYLNTQPRLPVVDYQVDSLTLEFYFKGKYQLITNINQLSSFPQPYYIIVNADALNEVQQLLKHTQLLRHQGGTSINNMMADLFLHSRLKHNLKQYMILKVN